GTRSGTLASRCCQTCSSNMYSDQPYSLSFCLDISDICDTAGILRAQGCRALFLALHAVPDQTVLRIYLVGELHPVALRVHLASVPSGLTVGLDVDLPHSHPPPGIRPHDVSPSAGWRLPFLDLDN